MTDLLHPTGKCRCAGEGKCEWCNRVASCGCKMSECPGCGDKAAWLDEALAELEARAAGHAAEAVRHGEHGRTELQASYHGMADGLREAIAYVRKQRKEHT